MNDRNKLPLSDRQLSIALELRNGLSKPKIAILLGISYETVKTHVDRIYEKLEIDNVPDLIKILNKFLSDKEEDNKEKQVLKP